MALLIRGLLGLASMGLLMQIDCGTFLSLTGCLPEFQPLFAALGSGMGTTTTGPILLSPTTKTTTSGIFLAVENNTAFNIEVHFMADGQELITQVPTAQTLKYELAPPDSNTIVTAQTIDLNGNWSDTLTTQTLNFVNGGLNELVDENGLTHVFNAADVVTGENVFSKGTVQRNAQTNSIVMVVTTDDPNATSTNTEARSYALAPGTDGNSLAGSSAVAFLDSTGNVIEGTDKTLTHTFVRQFPNALSAVGERDSDPATGGLVEEFTYDPPPAEVKAGVDYKFGQTVTFRVNATTVSFVISG
ncbi:MAG: hypothetical protein JXQ73_04765 [Phycisphaerae bacterium]|nr:hypothetical protein [Phycisphaerae bacterium]